MIKAIISIDEYRCCPNGYEAQTFRKGEIVTGAAAEYAIQDGAAKVVIADPPRDHPGTIPAQEEKRKPGRKPRPEFKKPAKPDEKKG